MAIESPQDMGPARFDIDGDKVKFTSCHRAACALARPDKTPRSTVKDGERVKLQWCAWVVEMTLLVNSNNSCNSCCNRSGRSSSQPVSRDNTLLCSKISS